MRRPQGYPTAAWWVPLCRKWRGYVTSQALDGCLITDDGGLHPLLGFVKGTRKAPHHRAMCGASGGKCERRSVSPSAKSFFGSQEHLKRIRPKCRISWIITNKFSHVSLLPFQDLHGALRFFQCRLHRLPEYSESTRSAKLVPVFAASSRFGLAPGFPALPSLGAGLAPWSCLINSDCLAISALSPGITFSVRCRYSTLIAGIRSIMSMSSCPLIAFRINASRCGTSASC